jgi:hypothetical protein
MTMQEKKSRIERLASEPLFYYRTLRDSVEELDSIKSRFQWLLAAYERIMDPAVRIRYEAEKREQRDQSLREVGAQQAASQPAAEQVISIEHLRMGQQVVPKGQPAILKANPGEQTIKITQEELDRLKADGNRITTNAPLEVTGNSVISGVDAERLRGALITNTNRAAPPAEIHLDLKLPTGNGVEDDTAAIQTGRGASAALKLTEQALANARQFAQGLPNNQDHPVAPDPLETKRIAARQKVGKEVSRLLKNNGINLTDEQLTDYMENKISKEELAAIARNIGEDSTYFTPGVEFPITQVGQAQRMVYGENGFLSKLLSPQFHRYGKGPVDIAAGTMNITYHRGMPGEGVLLELPNDLAQGVHAVTNGHSGEIGVLLELNPRSAENPQKYWAYLPQYLPTDRTPPMIFVAPDIPEHLDVARSRNGFVGLGLMGAEAVSDLTNRIIHALVTWLKNLNAPKQPEATKSEPAAAEPGFPPVPFDSKEYPIDHAIGRTQALIYGDDGLLKKLLGPSLHYDGAGKINNMTSDDLLTDSVVNTSKGQGLLIGGGVGVTNAPGTTLAGVYRTRTGMTGVMVRTRSAATGALFSAWLPLRSSASQPMPSIYIAEENEEIFYNFDSFLATERYSYMNALASFLHMWIRHLDQAGIFG